MSKIHQYLIICFVLLTNVFKAQQYNFKNYSVENGLPFVQIYTIFQDSKGYLWSGAYGGLSKFDGKEFVSYSPKNGLANHWVNAITEDTSHQIIVGTIEGLSMISEKGVKNYYTKDGLPSNDVNSLSIDYSGKLWVGTTKGLSYFSGKVFRTLKRFPPLSVQCLLSLENHNLIVGTESGLYQISSDLQVYKFPSLEGHKINSISQCPLKGILYVGTEAGLYELDPEKVNSVKVYHVNNGLLDEEITSVLCQRDGDVWIGSKSGLISFNGKEFSYYNINSDNNSNHIRSLMVDFEDNLWIGTHNGLFIYKGKGFTTYDRQDGLGGAFIYEIVQDQENNLWVTTETNGVYKFSGGYFKNYSSKEGLASNKSTSAIVMDDGSIWFGTERGISIFKNGKFENVDTEREMNIIPPINSFYKDSKGILWIGAHNGISSIEKKNNRFHVLKNYQLPASAKEYDVWGIIEDSKGTIWAGTYLAGLYKLENNQFKKQTVFDQALVETFLEFDKDDLGNIYVATLNGVLMFNPNQHQYKLITEKDGLSSELVYTIKLTKDKKYLWTGTNQGINKINIEKLQKNEIEIYSFGKADGFRGVECNTHGIFEGADSSIWFGTVNGLIRYSEKEFKKNIHYTKNVIKSIKLGYKDTLLKSGAVLPFSENNITFEFVGICLSNPEKVLYSFILEGADKKWSPPSTENFIRYSNLPEGKYTFKIKSGNNEGLWNEEPVTFSFTITPPFYRTWWFMLGFALAVSGLIIVVFRFRLKQIKQKQKLEYEQQVEVSKAELKALRAQMNPHFVFNSLNSIQHFILNSKGEEAVKYLNKFAKLIRLILNNSEKQFVTINEDLEAIKLYLELEQMRFDNKFDYKIVIHPSIDPDYDEIPPMLMQPYLENAILHGINPKETTGHLQIEIENTGQLIKCSIKDDGIGREKSAEIQNLNARGKHQSLGMKITKDRLRILNNMYQSELSVNIIDLYHEDQSAAGTLVEIFVPYAR